VVRQVIKKLLLTEELLYFILVQVEREVEALRPPLEAQHW
jgi:hypothetical protein